MRSFHSPLPPPPMPHSDRVRLDDTESLEDTDPKEKTLGPNEMTVYGTQRLLSRSEFLDEAERAVADIRRASQSQRFEVHGILRNGQLYHPEDFRD